MSLLKCNLDHSRTAYVFAVRAVPSDSALPCDSHGVRFDRPSQTHSMIIELGWAFFCRYEACLEAHLKDKGVQLSKKLSLLDWFNTNGICIPSSYKVGLSLYRQIRNKLHHEDGAAISGSQEEEIHLLPEHMENFYELFVWCGEQVDDWANKSVQRTPKSGAADL